jgi:dihydrofolate synthase/folylpolyglutamate synthase
MRVYFSLGSNLGDRRGNLLSALELISEKCALEKVSPVYETEPMYALNQPRFYNLAVEARTELAPEELLRFTQGIERKLKRKRTLRYGPRTLDIDILLYGSEVVNSPRLTVPHPMIAGRAFVLAPLADIAPDLVHPALHKTIRALRKLCPGLNGVVKVPASYKTAVDYLYALAPARKRAYGLEPENNILRLLSEPQQKYVSVHVAGSNGKSSVSMLLARALAGSGCRTGLYISPHVTDLRERISVDGAGISRGEFLDLFHRIHSFGAPLTFFEFTTALAFLYFAERKVDIAVIEAGIGGALDATNVIKPAVAIITSVSKEHEDILGPGLANIARHKAGVIKTGSTAVVNASGEALAVILRRAGAVKAEVVRPRAAGRGDVQLFGAAYQRENFELAAAAAGALKKHGFDIPRVALETAAKGFRPAARFEVRRLCGRTVIFDGAHNPAALEAFLSSARLFRKGVRLICVAGAMRDKDLKGMAALLGSRADHIFFTRPSSYRAAEPAVFAGYMAHCTNSHIVKDPGEAVVAALKLAGPHDIVAVCGSFYLISDVKAHFKGGKAVFPREMITA